MNDKISGDNISVRVFRKVSLREAYEAGVKTTIGDPGRWKEAFEAGEKKGSSWLNESVKAQSFFEFMNDKRLESPGSFNNWFFNNERRMATTLDRIEYEAGVLEKKIEKNRDKKEITLDAVEKAIRRAFKTPIHELRNNACREARVKRPRFFAMYLSYHYVSDPLKDIGFRFGGKHYATVYHGAKVVASDAKLYPEEMDLLQVIYKYLDKRGYNIYTRVGQGNIPGTRMPRNKAEWIEPKF